MLTTCKHCARMAWWYFSTCASILSSSFYIYYSVVVTVLINRVGVFAIFQWYWYRHSFFSLSFLCMPLNPSSLFDGKAIKLAITYYAPNHPIPSICPFSRYVQQSLVSRYEYCAHHWTSYEYGFFASCMNVKDRSQQNYISTFIQKLLLDE